MSELQQCQSRVFHEKKLGCRLHHHLIPTVEGRLDLQNIIRYIYSSNFHYFQTCFKPFLGLVLVWSQIFDIFACLDMADFQTVLNKDFYFSLSNQSCHFPGVEQRVKTVWINSPQAHLWDIYCIFIRSAFEIKVAEMMNFLKYKCFHFLWISHLVDMLQPVQSNVHSTGKF